VEVEDHPLDYGDFEGTIPKGQYGGGTVMVWDRGIWECEDPERAYRKGKLDFTLKGEKLQGGWILTRMHSREGEKRTNWLLIKHRDAFARDNRDLRMYRNGRVKAVLMSLELFLLSLFALSGVISVLHAIHLPARWLAIHPAGESIG
jgi:bifunctional non-homologous end joining protein LigD